MCKIKNVAIKLVFLISTTVLFSCSTTYYSLKNSEQVATVSFSNLSRETPEIYIVNNCKSERIKVELIENKKPQERAKYKTEIPAGKTISLNYNYNWILTEKHDLITEGTILSAIPINKTKVSKGISSCSNLISFTPEANKHYEVYFAISGGKCQIKASEAIAVTDSKNNLYSIPISNENACSD